MAEITMKTMTGQDAGRARLDDAVFGLTPNVAVMHQVVTAQLANRRAGTHSTKTRSEVRGGGAKPYRQKGTGNARQGSTNSPQFVGGGIALGPKPRSYAQRTPKKMIKLALRSALSDRAADGKVVVVDDWGMAAPRTKDAVAALGALGLGVGRVLIVVESFDTAVARSFRNLPLVQLIKASELNAYDVLCNDWIVFTQSNLPTAGTSDTDEMEDDALIAVHGTDPAEGPRDEAIDDPTVARTEGPADGNDGSAPDRSERDGPTGGEADVQHGTDGSAPDRSDDETRTGGEADEQHATDGSAPDRSEPDSPTGGEADEQHGTDGLAPDRSDDETRTGGEADEQQRTDGSAPDRSELDSPTGGEADEQHGTDGSARAAVSDGPGTGVGSASEQPESDEERASSDEEDHR